MERECVICQHPLKDNELVVITKTTTMKNRRQFANMANMKSLCIHLAQQSLVICISLSLVCPLTVSGQPNQLPPESFQCGPVHFNVICERWGYDACISDNGEFYCLPCSQEYLTTLCETQKEVNGCNLYCTEMAVDKERGKITTNFTEQLTYQKIQTVKYMKEVDFHVRRIKALETSLRNKTIAVYAIIAVLCLVVLILAGFIIRYIRQKCIKTRHDEENPEPEIPEPEPSELTPFNKEENSDDTSETSDETQLKGISVLPDSIEDLKVSDNEQQYITTPQTDKSNDCQESECPAITKLNSVPATNTKGNDKLAIKNKDLSHSYTPAQ